MNIRIKQITDNYPLTLLLTADPDIKKIEKYLNKGQCFAAVDGCEIIGEYVLRFSKNEAEIENLAVAEKQQKKGIGTLLINDAIARAKKENIGVLKIATGKDTYQQRFYESVGFRVISIDFGYFERVYDAPIKDGGLVLKDRVILEMTLK